MKRKLSKRWYNLIEIGFIIAIVIVGIKTLQQKKEYQQNEVIYRELWQEVPRVREWLEEVPVAEEGTEEVTQKTNYLEDLKARNDQVVAWIEIPDTMVRYPVLQGEDNDYYLNHNLDGKQNRLGSIFMDWENDASLVDRNTVIYGHRAIDGSMFAGLKELRKSSYLKEHPLIYLTLDDRILTYEIVSVYITRPEEDYRGRYEDDDDFQAFLERIMAKASTPYEGEQLTLEDSILTLSTCAYDFTDARLVVHGKLLAEEG